MSLGAIILVLFGIVILLWGMGKLKGSNSVVVTKAGVLKTHDVECKFRTGALYHGDLDQSQWSDGQERFSINLRKLPDAYSGQVSMLHKGAHVADLEAANGRIDFSWKGQAGADKPKFEIGDEVRLEFGGHVLTGIVEPD